MKHLRLSDPVTDFQVDTSHTYVGRFAATTCRSIRNETESYLRLSLSPFLASIRQLHGLQAQRLEESHFCYGAILNSIPQLFVLLFSKKHGNGSKDELVLMGGKYQKA
jgi:hypothetical protein